MSFPAWGMATLITAGSVWIVAQYDTSYAWGFAMLILLSVVTLRGGFWPQANALIDRILST